MNTATAFIAVFIWTITQHIQATTFEVPSQGISDIIQVTIPANTSEVNFWNNNITVIPHGYFVSLPELVRINLRSNHIRNIMDHSFSAVASLRVLLLGKNQLSFVTSEMFRGLHNLTQLRLNNNRLRCIQKGSFRDLRALAVLSLKDNLLTSLHECIFDPSNRPIHVELLLYKNKWMCGPELCWLSSAIGDWVTLRGWATPAQCASPSALTGHDLGSATGQDLRCANYGKYKSDEAAKGYKLVSYTRLVLK